MRKIIFVLFISILVKIFTINAQEIFTYKQIIIEPAELVVTYRMNYLQDTLDIDSRRDDEMLLFIGKKNSCFLSSGYYSFINSLKKINTIDGYNEWLMNPQLRPAHTSAFSYRILKSYSDGRITFYGRVIPNSFNYDEYQQDFNWEIHEDIITINEYQCQKATTHYGGRYWIAWFCPTLPFNDGPYKFSGLPGLILKMHDAQDHYSFIVSSIEKANEGLMIEINDEKYVKTTRKGFLKAEDSFRNDIINRAKDAGLNEDSQYVAARNMLRRNNPIELDRK